MKDDGEVFSIGGIDINTKNINEAGTIKVSIEQQATYSVYRGEDVSIENKIAAEKTLTTKNGMVRHGGIEYKLDNTTVFTQGVYEITPGMEGLSTVSIPNGTTDPTVFTYADSDSDSEYVSVADLVEKINSHDVLKNLYVASLNDGKVVLTEKRGSEGLAWDSANNSSLISGTVTTVTERTQPATDASTKFSITNNALAFQIGPNTNQNVMIDVPRLDIVTLGIEEINVTTQVGANEAIFTLDQAINTLSDVRAKLGATQNRMEHTINNLQVTHENLTASESRIRDADMALEMTEFTRNNILNQAATAMLAQANQLPQGVLQLLQ